MCWNLLYCEYVYVFHQDLSSEKLELFMGSKAAVQDKAEVILRQSFHVCDVHMYT